MDHQLVAKTSFVCLLNNGFNLNRVEMTLNEDKRNDYPERQTG
ncbi:hypothetical protein [Exiguobacterium sp. S22-S28]